MEKEFITVESKSCKYINTMTNILMYSFFLGLPTFTTLFLLYLEEYGTGFLIMLVFLGILIFWRSSVYEKKTQIKRMIVNKDGIFYYNNENKVADKVLYTDLCGYGFTYDIGINLEYKYPVKEFTVFNPRKKRIRFHLEAVNADLKPLLQALNNGNISSNSLNGAISNEVELQKHFIRGIQIFRPDLKIDPLILKLFRL
ncbi:hypothetical protein EH151_04350 [Elizabethkingia anophelis]|uniref:hypothetical protein n=1 Tax=Elizabethkingia anophelis TaxID=1117645 RepID=UPI00136AAC5E|nr:hypothetical protein [Elizabethkingia anophelis]MYZ59120.1 hypothetical protein [Elizabethkingia anophelis]